MFIDDLQGLLEEVSDELFGEGKDADGTLRKKSKFIVPRKKGRPIEPYETGVTPLEHDITDKELGISERLVRIEMSPDNGIYINVSEGMHVLQSVATTVEHVYNPIFWSTDENGKKAREMDYKPRLILEYESFNEDDFEDVETEDPDEDDQWWVGAIDSDG